MAAPQFNVIQLVSPSAGASAGVSSAPIPCQAGDLFLFTGTLRLVSGVMQPTYVLLFYEANGTGLVPAVLMQAVTTDNGWHIWTATATAPTGAATAILSAYCPSGTTSTTWELSDFRLAQNGTPLYAPLNNFGMSLTGLSYLQEFIYPLYYLSLITSEYQQAPQFYAWRAAELTPITDLMAVTQQMYTYFAIPGAVGAQLDVIGAIVGANRLLPFQPSGLPAISATTSNTISPLFNTVADVNNTTGMTPGRTVTVDTGGNAENVTIISVNSGVSFNATFTKSHSSGVAVTAVAGAAPSALLNDADYTTLILAQIARNQWDGSIGEIYQLWNQIFPGLSFVFLDNQNMTCNAILSAQLSQIQLQMIENDLILPRPQAVLYIYQQPELPVFGFNGDGSIIAGFDSGKWA